MIPFGDFLLADPQHLLAYASAGVACALVIVSAFVRTMIPLRWLAVGSNVGFILYGLMQPNPLAKTDRTQYPVPSQFMTQANTALTHCLEKSSFITASLFLIDYENGGFMFARAGHCHTLYYSSNQEKVEYFRSTGLGLGIIRSSGYEKHINNQFYDYAPGDVMVMYTDGIVEARGAGAAEYGENRLMQRLEESYYRTAEEIKSFIIDDLNTFTAGQPMHDDQTLLVIKFKAAQPSSRA